MISLPELLTVTLAAGTQPLAWSASVLAYRPFIDPIDELIDAHRLWFLLLIPLALLVSMAYKAVRIPTMQDFWRQVAVMTVQIVVAIIGLGAASFIVIQFIVPRIVPH
ncbi:MAG: hypothetical protein SFZ23_02230 [Planctomycetota bacterium]|nr:hypothetical protein [Planctomycetota bacterium]